MRNENEVSASEMRGPLGELLDQFSGQNSRERFEEFKLWLKGVTASPLSFVTTVYVPAVKRFVVSEVLGTTGVNRDGVRIDFLGQNFQAQFGGLVEENIPAAELVVSRLERYADVLEIAGAIPREKRVVRISQIYRLVRNQADGEAGPLLVDGWANLFLAYGADSNFWLVYVYRCGGGWGFDARPLDCPVGWCDGRRVFSRK